MMKEERLENTILRNLLTNEKYTRKVLPFLKESYFTQDAEKIVFEQIRSYVDKYNNIPTKEALVIDLGDKKGITEEEFNSSSNLLNQVLENQEETDNDWLLDSTERFCQDKAVYNAVMESIQILDETAKSNKDNKDKGAIPEILTDALAINFDTHIGHDYLDDSDSRYDFYHKKEERTPFDLEYFNRITKNGIPNKTLNVALAGTGVGKSLFMCHMAGACLSQGNNVLYITLEMAEERIAERIDANLLNTALDDLRKLPKTLFNNKIEKLRKKIEGKLIIKEYPTASANCSHFKALLGELKIKKNFVPKIIFIDYLNLCTSSRFRQGGNFNSYSYIKSIAEEMRGMAVEHNLPIMTATQVNRQGFVSTDIGLEDTSESFGLPATADFMFALMTTEKLEQLNQIKVKQLKNRYNDPTYHRNFIVGIDRSKMKLYDVEEEAQEDLIDEESESRTEDRSSKMWQEFSKQKKERDFTDWDVEGK